MTLPAPGLFSTITVCPSETDTLLAIMRAMTSGLAPADCETMNVTGRCGQLCADAFPNANETTTARAAASQRAMWNSPAFLPVFFAEVIAWRGPRDRGREVSPARGRARAAGAGRRR